MPVGNLDFREVVTGHPGLETLPREKLAKAVYLKDRRALPDDLKRLFESADVLRIPITEPEEISRAISVANGEIAGVNLGLKAETLHYLRTQLAMLKDREVSVDWGPREDIFDGEVLPQLDGLNLDLESLKEITVDGEHGVVRCEVGARWKEVFDSCASKGWLFPLFPVLPINHYIGDVIGGTDSLTSYGGGAERYVRNVDFLAPDARYGESGFDRVPNNAAGYDLNSLLLVMGRHITVPVSITFALHCSAEDCKTLSYGLEGPQDLEAALQRASSTRVRPLKVLFGDSTGSKVVFGREDSFSIEFSIHGTAKTLPYQERVVDSLFEEGTEKEERGELTHPLKDRTRRVTPSPLAEFRTSSSDLSPLLQDLIAWREAQGASFGMAGSLLEGGTISLLPFINGPVGRGERYDRVVELVQIARKHPCQLRANASLQLLSPESSLERRFALVRSIKEQIDMPNVINPSNVLWIHKRP